MEEASKVKGEKRKLTGNHDFQKKNLKAEGDTEELESEATDDSMKNLKTRDEEEKEDANECEDDTVMKLDNISYIILYNNRYKDLFDDEDRSILEKYRELDLTSQKLFIKLNKLKNLTKETKEAICPKEAKNLVEKGLLNDQNSFITGVRSVFKRALYVNDLDRRWYEEEDPDIQWETIPYYNREPFIQGKIESRKRQEWNR